MTRRKKLPVDRVGQPKRTHSEATKEKQRQKALEQGERRREEIQARIGAAQATMVAERAAKIEAAGTEGGVPAALQLEQVSRADILRLAMVNETTLLNNEKYEGFLKELDSWLKRINFKADEKLEEQEFASSSGRSLKDRLAAWRTAYAGLAQSHRDSELELQNTQALLQERNKDVEGLKAEVNKLTQALQSASGKVVGLPIR